MDICPCGAICTCKQCSALSGCVCEPGGKCECPCTSIPKPIKVAAHKVATLEPSDEFLDALIAPWEKPNMPFEFVMQLALPWTGAIQEYIDANESELKNQYTQHRLFNFRGARDDVLLKQVGAEADNYLENTLPQKMLDLVDLEQAGYPLLVNKIRTSVSIGDNPEKMDLSKYEDWVNVRLNPKKLDSLADAAANAVLLIHKAASLLQIAARMATDLPPNSLPTCPICGQPEDECYTMCPGRDPYHSDQRFENEDLETSMNEIDPIWGEPA